MQFVIIQFVLLATLLAPALGAPATENANPGDQVIVVYNKRVPESKQVAEHYAAARRVPASQVLGLDLSTGSDMSRAEYREKLEKPLGEKISDLKLWKIRSQFISGTSNAPSRILWKPSESKIHYAVLCYGVPFRIRPEEALKEKEASAIRPELRRNEAAVDTELALLPMNQSTLALTGPAQNPLYGSTNEAHFSATNGVLMVTRLDGPTAQIAMSLVDKALEAEKDGLWGRAYIDMRNIADTNYGIGDNWLRGAAEICRQLGFETIVDTNAGTFSASFPMSHIAYYAGWYDNDVSGPFTREKVEFQPGAFAYHLHSYSAANLRNPKENWVGPLLAKGATASMGCVAEPYLGGTPEMAVFTSRFFFFGMNFAQAAYAAQPVLSWQMTIVGDPLYRPFSKPAQKQHEELAAAKGKGLEWSFLRLANLNLARGLAPAQAQRLLEQIPLTKQSAVLTEKLADLYSSGGKPSSAVEMWERALDLNPSSQQSLRIRLALADKLVELDRKQEALQVLARIPQDNPHYPGCANIYRRLASLAAQLGKKETAAEYEERAKEAGK